MQVPELPERLTRTPVSYCDGCEALTADLPGPNIYCAACGEVKLPDALSPLRVMDLDEGDE